MATTLVVTAAMWAAASSGAVVSPPRAQPTTELASLIVAHRSYAAPTRSSRPLRPVSARRPLTGERTVLPVVAHAPNGWLRVRLPGRPNGRTGWIEQRQTIRAVTRWRLVIETSKRRVTVYEGGHAVRTVSAIVGKPSTPTPQGEFFVEEAIKLGASDVGAPFALALSARSTVLQEFAGGPGQIGVHGLRNVGGVLGTAVSHGCVRVDNATMRWLVLRIGPGTPVTITR